MRIIHVAGTSGSGKTRFITHLVPRLARLGEVACVKHLGEHTFALEEGKDTTRYLEAGAGISCGIDRARAVLMIGGADLPGVLDMLADAGTDFAIVEGWKSLPYRKIALGDLEAENCILRDPSVEEVVDHLGSFDEHTTTPGLVKQLLRERGGERVGAILTFTGRVRKWTGDEETGAFEVPADIPERLGEVKRSLLEVPGIEGVGVGHRSGRLHPGDEITRVAILAEHRAEGTRALADALRILADRAGTGRGRGRGG